MATEIAANTTLPPPRRTGQTPSDLLMQLRWFNDFYDQFTKVLNVPGVIQALNDSGLQNAPAGWFDTVTTEMAALTKQATDLTTSANSLTTQVATLTTSVNSLTTALNALEAVLTTSGILPLVAAPSLNNTAIHLLLNNNGGVNAPRVTLSVADGGGTGFRALLVPN